MIVSSVLSALATQLDTISGLRVYDYQIGSVAVPAAIVGFPTEIEYDLSANRGQDHMELEVAVLAGKVSDRTAMDVLSAYVDGSGSASVKQVLEANNRTYTAFSRVRVRSCSIEMVSVGAVEYLAAIFMLDIYGGN